MKPLPDFSPYFDREQPLPGELIAGRKYRQVPAETYHAWPALNASLLKEPTAAHMLHELRTTKEVTIEARTVGALVHWATLEPEKIRDLNNLVVACPTKGLDTKAAEATRAENPGKLVVGPEHLEMAFELRRAIEAHGEALSLLSQPAEREASGFLFDEGMWRKWRVDFLPHDHSALIDIKSTRVELAGDFGKRCWVSECWANGYWLQAAWYLHHHEMLTGIRPAQWIWICVSKAAPFYCRVFKMENLSPRHPLYAQSMICRARQILGLDDDSAGRLTVFREAATRTRLAIERGEELNQFALRRIWEAMENETDGPEIGLPQAIAA